VAGAVGETGGNVDGTSVGATRGGAVVLRVVSGRPLPPLFPGEFVADDCGSARKLMRSGWMGCSFGPNSDVNG
jgi:hypothetical protein